MAVIRSIISTQTGEKLLIQSLQDRVSTGRRLTVAEQHAAAYLWSKQTVDQYPTKLMGTPMDLVSQEQSLGIVTNLNT